MVGVRDDGLDLGRTLAYPIHGALVDWSFTDPAYGGVAGDGVHTVYVQWQDGSGTWSPVASATVLVDTTPPRGTASTDVGSAWTASTTVHVTTAATDALTGTTHVRLSNVDWTDADGELQPGTSFPAGVEMPIPWDFSPAGEGVCPVAGRRRQLVAGDHAARPLGLLAAAGH
jgi:hypothetical protein